MDKNISQYGKFAEGKKGTRVAKLIDSSYLPESEAAFIIKENGINDVGEKEKEK